MFKFLTVGLLACALSMAAARPQASDASTPVPIVAQAQSEDGTGSFSYSFESGDGTKEDASGQLKSIKVPKTDPATGVTTQEDGMGVVQQGKYSYTAPDGTPISVEWIADENVSREYFIDLLLSFKY